METYGQSSIRALYSAGVRVGGAAAFGVPGGDDGEAIVIVLEADESVEAAVVDQVAADFGVRPSVGFVGQGELPRTSSGKLRRPQARQAWMER